MYFDVVNSFIIATLCIHGILLLHCSYTSYTAYICLSDLVCVFRIERSLVVAADYSTGSIVYILPSLYNLHMFQNLRTL